LFVILALRRDLRCLCTAINVAIFRQSAQLFAAMITAMTAATRTVYSPFNEGLQEIPDSMHSCLTSNCFLNLCWNMRVGTLHWWYSVTALLSLLSTHGMQLWLTACSRMVLLRWPRSCTLIRHWEEYSRGASNALQYTSRMSDSTSLHGTTNTDHWPFAAVKTCGRWIAETIYYLNFASSHNKVSETLSATTE